SWACAVSRADAGGAAPSGARRAPGGRSVRVWWSVGAGSPLVVVGGTDVVVTVPPVRGSPVPRGCAAPEATLPPARALAGRARAGARGRRCAPAPARRARVRLSGRARRPPRARPA